MGFSIFLQNTALMLMTADLRDIPPVFARSRMLRPIYIKDELLLGFVITLA
jgi:branched-chain amino acid transport system permease protein